MHTPDPYPTGARPDEACPRFGPSTAFEPLSPTPLADDARFDAMPPDPDLDAHLAGLLAATPRCPAPSGFTDRVMAALPLAASGSTQRSPTNRPAAPPSASRASRWRVRWGSAATLALVVIVIGATLIGLPRRSQPTSETPVSAAEVAEAREQVELALSLLGRAHRKAETDATRLIAP